MGIELRARRNADDSHEAHRGLEVVRVTPEGAGDRAGVCPGDFIEFVNDQQVTDARQLVSYVRTLVEGAPLVFVVDRQAEKLELSGQTIALPVEQIAHAHVCLDEVIVANHRLRLILTTPKREGSRYPTILYLQGIGTQSCEVSSDSDEPLRKLLEGFSAAGFATLRVERSGVGDSEGPPIAQTNLFDEVAAYRAALDFLGRHPHVGPIFLFGHSVGGMVAPLLAGEETNIAGIIVFGTSALRWVDCIVQATRRQKKLAGMSGDELENYVSAWADMHHAVCRGGLFPEQVFLQWPDLGWIEGSACRGQTIFGRHASFFQQLERLDLVSLWKTVRTRVRVLHGEFDWACHPDEGRVLANAIATVDSTRVTFVELDHVGHDMRRHTTIETSYTNPRMGRWDERVVNRAVEWMQRISS